MREWSKANPAGGIIDSASRHGIDSVASNSDDHPNSRIRDNNHHKRSDDTHDYVE